MKYAKTVGIIAVLAVILIAALLLYPKLAAYYRNSGTAEPSTAPTEPTANASTEIAPTAPVVLAPDFTVMDTEGQQVSLSDYFGKPIVVNFWASWCAPCKSELPAFDKLAAQYGDRVAFLMVNLTDGSSETVDGVKDFVADNGYSFPLFFDTDYSASIAYGITSIPVTILIGADGGVVNSHLGAMDEGTLEAYIQALIGDETE